jgi:peptidoglycan/xylan/chitin deacetylase (PgdA/CDA1 family)
MTPIIANFHGIGEPHPWADAGERRFWLATEQFREAIDLLARSGKPVCATFDDGNQSDLDHGVPLCREAGMSVSVLVCSGRLGKKGYLDRAALRDIAAQDRCRIGSHGKDHVPWKGLTDSALLEEVAGSRKVIEDTIGARVDEAGIPFGAYDRRVLRALRKAGYRRLFSSDGGPRLRRGGVWPRLSLRGDQPIAPQVEHLLESASLLRATRQEAKLTVKQWL